MFPLHLETFKDAVNVLFLITINIFMFIKRILAFYKKKKNQHHGITCGQE